MVNPNVCTKCGTTLIQAGTTCPGCGALYCGTCHEPYYATLGNRCPNCGAPWPGAAAGRENSLLMVLTFWYLPLKAKLAVAGMLVLCLAFFVLLFQFF